MASNTSDASACSRSSCVGEQVHQSEDLDRATQFVGEFVEQVSRVSPRRRRRCAAASASRSPSRVGPPCWRSSSSVSARGLLLDALQRRRWDVGLRVVEPFTHVPDRRVGGQQFDRDGGAWSGGLHPCGEFSVDAAQRPVEFTFAQSVVVDDVVAQGGGEPAPLDEHVLGALSDDGDRAEELADVCGFEGGGEGVVEDGPQVLLAVPTGARRRAAARTLRRTRGPPGWTSPVRPACVRYSSSTSADRALLVAEVAQNLSVHLERPTPRPA